MTTVYRVKPDVFKLDLVSVTRLQTMTDYVSLKPAYTTAAVNVLHEEYQQARAKDICTQDAAKATRDALTTAEWALHNAMLGVKEQVIAQYGSDSDEVQALGLKKKSKYRSRSLRKPKES